MLSCFVRAQPCVVLLDVEFQKPNDNGPILHEARA